MKTKLISLLILSLVFALHAGQKIKRTWAKTCPDCGTVVLSSKITSNGGYTDAQGQNWRWVSVQFRCPHCKDGVSLGNFSGKLPDELVRPTNQQSLLGAAGAGRGKPVKSYKPPMPIPSPKAKK